MRSFSTTSRRTAPGSTRSGAWARNSSLPTTSPLWRKIGATGSRRVPGGTVDSRTTRLPGRNTGTRARLAASTRGEVGAVVGSDRCGYTDQEIARGDGLGDGAQGAGEDGGAHEASSSGSTMWIRPALMVFEDVAPEVEAGDATTARGEDGGGGVGRRSRGRRRHVEIERRPNCSDWGSLGEVVTGFSGMLSGSRRCRPLGPGSSSFLALAPR